MNGHKILVVDDDELILQSMEAILEDEGQTLLVLAMAKRHFVCSMISVQS